MDELYTFRAVVSGSMKGTVDAKSKKEAIELIEAGQWDDVDIDVENVIEIEYVKKGR